MTEQENNPFSGPQMQDSKFERADMARTNFNGVNLDGARFFAVLTSVTFTDCNMASVSFDDVNMSGSTFHNINLSGTGFDNINMSQCRFSNLNLSGLSIRSAKMANVEIADSDYTGMKIDGVLVSELFKAYGEKG